MTAIEDVLKYSQSLWVGPSDKLIAEARAELHSLEARLERAENDVAQYRAFLDEMLNNPNLDIGEVRRERIEALLAAPQGSEDE